MESEEEFGLRDEFATPFERVDFHALHESPARVVEARPVEFAVARHPAGLRFAGGGAVDDPAQDAEVFAEAWPEEFVVGTFAEPVHMEDPRRVAEVATFVHLAGGVVTVVKSAVRVQMLFFDTSPLTGFYIFGTTPIYELPGLIHPAWFGLEKDTPQ